MMNSQLAPKAPDGQRCAESPQSTVIPVTRLPDADHICRRYPGARRSSLIRKPQFVEVCRTAPLNLVMAAMRVVSTLWSRWRYCVDPPRLYASRTALEPLRRGHFGIAVDHASERHHYASEPKKIACPRVCRKRSSWKASGSSSASFSCPQEDDLTNCREWLRFIFSSKHSQQNHCWR